MFPKKTVASVTDIGGMAGAVGGILMARAASVGFTHRWRLPKHTAALDVATQAGLLRICREVATERDMFSTCGTLFELPAENADGFAKIRPIASHDLHVMDYGAYRGLLLMSGVKPDGRSKFT